MLYLKILALPLIISVVLVLRIILSVQNPPYITGRKEGGELLTVYSWALRKGGGFYREFKYKKRKNGRYFFKYSVFDLVCILFPLISIFGGFFVIFYYCMESIIKYPDIWIPFFIVLFFSLLELYVIANFSQIVARIYFRKYLKND